MLKTTFKILRNIQLTEGPKPLGRWKVNNEIFSNINGSLANVDCCGDKLCGDQTTTKIIINQELKKNLNKI